MSKRIHTCWLLITAAIKVYQFHTRTAWFLLLWDTTIVVFIEFCHAPAPWRLLCTCPNFLRFPYLGRNHTCDVLVYVIAPCSSLQIPLCVQMKTDQGTTCSYNTSDRTVPSRRIPYSGKLSREKIFTNFADLMPFVKVFPTKKVVVHFGLLPIISGRR